MPNDGYENPATKGDGGDRTVPKVNQTPVNEGGYITPAEGDKGQRGATAKGGASPSDGYDNMGINTDGPGPMGKPGSKYPSSIKATGKGTGNQWGK